MFTNSEMRLVCGPNYITGVFATLWKMDRPRELREFVTGWQ